MRLFNIFLISSILAISSVSHSEINGTLRAEELLLISPDYTEVDRKHFELFGARVKSNNNATDVFKIDLTGMYAIGYSVLSYLNIQEIYYTYEIDEKSKFHIGRKIHSWSGIDDLWNMAIFQPEFKWNRLDPHQQGLFGVFWDKNESNWGLTLFASPIYLPDQGASYEIKDGQFQSGNPFFRAPPQNVKFQNQLLPIDYEIDKPETSDVIFQSILGLQLRFGEDKGWFGSLAGIYKPSNQLALGYKGVLVTTRVRVDVTPKTYYENSYSGEIGYKDDWGHFQFSVLHNDPQTPEFDSSFNRPVFESSLMWGPQFLYRFSPRFRLFVAYFDTTGGEVTDVGPDASSDRASLSERFLYREAALLKVGYSDVFMKKIRLDSDLQYKFSPKEKFREISFKNKINLKGPWSFWMDLILVDTDSNVPSGMESYKNLDQLWLGAGYDI